MLLFGLAGAVLHFNRIPTFLTAFCRRVLAIPITHFFDDFRLVEMKMAGGSGWEFFKRVADIFGIRFDPAKDQPPAPKYTMLGNLEDFTQLSASESMVIHAKPERITESPRNPSCQF